MHALIFGLVVGLIAGYKAGSRTVLGRLGRVERRSRQRSLGGR